MQIFNILACPYHIQRRRIYRQSKLIVNCTTLGTALQSLHVYECVRLSAVYIENAHKLFNHEVYILIKFCIQIRVGIKPGFYHKAQPGGFYGFYEGVFMGFYGFYVDFINLKVYHLNNKS